MGVVLFSVLKIFKTLMVDDDGDKNVLKSELKGERKIKIQFDKIKIQYFVFFKKQDDIYI